MKNYKRTLAAMTAGLLALTPCFAAGMTAVAATLTVHDADSATHTYNAYQIITGQMNNGKLTDLEWGDGIDSETLISVLNTNRIDLGINTIAADSTPQTVAEVLSKITDSDKKNKLAKVIATAKTSDKFTLTKSSFNYSDTTLDEGWYLILDETTPLNTEDPDTVRSANILELTKDTSIETKHSLPTLDKVIIEDGNELDANTAAIGDVITYNIKTKVPDTTGYNKYFFFVEDTLSSGLTFNSNSVSIQIYDKDDTEKTTPKDTLTKEADTNYTDEDGDYYVTNNNGNIKFVFEDVINKFDSYDVGDDIVISYTATLNENANLSPTVGNPNTAKLSYSNDPNVTYNGTPETTPDEPSSGEVVGETPEDKVNTFTTAIKIKKVDQNNDPLTGASFTLTGSNLNKVKKVSGTTYEIDDTDGTYWKLKTGAFTTTDPNTPGLSDEAKAKYANDDHMYKKVDATATELTATGAPLSITSTVDDDGYITFYGLNAGDYTLIESVVPQGYNPASDITFTIDAEDLTTASVTWTIEDADVSTYDEDEFLFPITVVNREGAILPTTGGIGTKLFYLFGGMLVVGSSVVLITKKRMSADDN